jgi:hypothetical protein
VWAFILPTYLITRFSQVMSLTSVNPEPEDCLADPLAPVRTREQKRSRHHFRQIPNV